MDISAYQQHMNMRMSTRGKRPLRNLTPSDKVRAIQRIHNGETKASVSRDIGVPESTLRGWCKNEQKLRFMCRQLNGNDQLGAINGRDITSSSTSSSSLLPDKRNRYESHIKTPQYPGNTSSSFYEDNYNRSTMNSLNSLRYGSNGSNAILEKIAFNEIMKNHGFTMSGAIDNGGSNGSGSNNHKNTTSSLSSASLPSTDPLSNVPIDSTSLGSSDFNQYSIMQNLNLLSLLNPALTGISSSLLTGNNAAPSTTGLNLNGATTATNGINGDNNNKKDNGAAFPLHITADDMTNDIPKNTIKNTNNIYNNSNNSSSNSNNNNDNNNTNGTAMALSVKDWAKDPVKDDLNGVNGTNANYTRNQESNNHNNNKNDNNNNSVNQKLSNNSNNNKNDNNTALNGLNIESLNFLPSLPFPFLQPPTNIANVANMANGDTAENVNTVLMEWYKVFSASLNFLALATAAAALQPVNNNVLPNILCGNDIINLMNGNSTTNYNTNMNGDGFNHHQKDNNNSNDSTEENILYKELTKKQFETNVTTTINNNNNNIDNNNINNNIDNNITIMPTHIMNSDASNDSSFESEPEDLSVRSTATSKLSSPLNSCTESPVPIKSLSSCSPRSLSGDIDQ